MISPGRVLRRVAFGVMVAIASFFTLFAGGETLSDPGGWRGVGLLASWAVPMAGLVFLAIRRPNAAAITLAAVAVAVLGLQLWAGAHAARWTALEDRIGPVRAIVTFALAGPIAVLGLRRAGAAGWMLLALGAVPLILASLTPARTSAPLRVIGIPMVLGGLLFLGSALIERGRA